MESLTTDVSQVFNYKVFWIKLRFQSTKESEMQYLDAI